MNVRVLIDAIVRQTTILIAQLATTAGVRAPLAHIANQVFLDLVNELEAQGVSRKVAADMFGMALRSYQQKVQRLSESATERGVTLWQAVYSHLQDVEVASRAEVLRRFRHDDEASVRGILHDLVESGLVYRSGRGDATMFRAAPEDDIARLSAASDADSAASLVWVHVYRAGTSNPDAIQEALGIDPDALTLALEQLEASGRVRKTDEDAWTSDACLIPLEDDAGWGAALFDHYQSVVTAVCTKLQNGTTRAHPDDRLGGSTFSFDVWDDHPYAPRVYALLAQKRAEIISLWDEVHAYNDAHERPEGAEKVTFYLGQSIQSAPHTSSHDDGVRPTPRD